MSFPGARTKRFSKKVEVDSTFYKGNSKGAACRRQSALCIAHLPQSPGCCAQPRLKSRFVTAHCRNFKINIVFFYFMISPEVIKCSSSTASCWIYHNAVFCPHKPHPQSSAGCTNEHSTSTAVAACDKLTTIN